MAGKTNAERHCGLVKEERRLLGVQYVEQESIPWSQTNIQ